MLRKKKTRAIRARQNKLSHMPTAQDLLTHISKAMFTSGMLFLYVAGAGLVMLLDYNHIPIDIPIIFVFVPLILFALVNGSSAWQRDRHDYHRRLAERHSRNMERTYSRNP
jgi:hypothetical protein